MAQYSTVDYSTNPVLEGLNSGISGARNTMGMIEGYRSMQDSQRKREQIAIEDDINKKTAADLAMIQSVQTDDGFDKGSGQNAGAPLSEGLMDYKKRWDTGNKYDQYEVALERRREHTLAAGQDTSQLDLALAQIKKAKLGEQSAELGIEGQRSSLESSKMAQDLAKQKLSEQEDQETARRKRLLNAGVGLSDAVIGSVDETSTSAMEKDLEAKKKEEAAYNYLLSTGMKPDAARAAAQNQYALASTLSQDRQESVAAAKDAAQAEEWRKQNDALVKTFGESMVNPELTPAQNFTAVNKVIDDAKSQQSFYNEVLKDPKADSGKKIDALFARDSLNRYANIPTNKSADDKLSNYNNAMSASDSELSKLRKQIAELNTQGADAGTIGPVASKLRSLSDKVDQNTAAAISRSGKNSSMEELEASISFANKNKLPLSLQAGKRVYIEKVGVDNYAEEQARNVMKKRNLDPDDPRNSKVLDSTIGMIKAKVRQELEGSK